MVDRSELRLTSGGCFDLLREDIGFWLFTAGQRKYVRGGRDSFRTGMLW